MRRRMFSSLALGLLLAGIILLASGLGTMITAMANAAFAETAFGLMSILGGGMSWTLGVRLARGAVDFVPAPAHQFAVAGLPLQPAEKTLIPVRAVTGIVTNLNDFRRSREKPQSADQLTAAALVA